MTKSVVRAEDETTEDTEEEASSATTEDAADETDEDGVIGQSPDVVTTVLFPESTSRRKFF